MLTDGLVRFGAYDGMETTMLVGTPMLKYNRHI